MVCSQPKLLRQVAWWLGWRAINTCCKLLPWALTEKKVFGMDLHGLILGQNPEPIGWGTPDLVAWDAEKSFLSRESKKSLYPLPYYLFAKKKKKVPLVWEKSLGEIRRNLQSLKFHRKERNWEALKLIFFFKLLKYNVGKNMSVFKLVCYMCKNLYKRERPNGVFFLYIIWRILYWERITLFGNYQNYHLSDSPNYFV